MQVSVWLPNCRGIADLREVGVEHLVIEFLAADGPELDEQMALFAERIRPKLA